jgi:bifunctional ADP-heptose synthase (sugar kinase/adenylyltransferase)
MFNRVVNLFKRPAASKVIEPKGATADSVRKYAKATFITPARQRGEKRVTFSASDIHRGMNLHSRMPLVCSSIDAKKFAEFARVELVKRDGVKQGASAKWTFKLL